MDKDSHCKIRLAAIAKDEAAYLPEWIFYHLWLGFDQITVYINNTSDNSIAILKKIASNYPMVEYQVVDGIENKPDCDYLLNEKFTERNPLQSRAYAEIYANTDKTEYSHLMFLDIDEFFYPKLPLKELIANSNVNVQLFHWFNLAGDKESFSRINKVNLGERDKYTKFILKTGLTGIKLESTHDVSDVENNKVIDLEGLILHRNLRSKMEYVSLLGRQDTFKNTLNGFKKNRNGWSSFGQEKLEISQEIYEFFEKELVKNINETELNDAINDAKSFVITRYHSVKSQVKDIQNLNKDLEKILFGTNLQHHHYSLRYLIKCRLKQWLSPPNVNRHL